MRVRVSLAAPPGEKSDLYRLNLHMEKIMPLYPFETVLSVCEAGDQKSPAYRATLRETHDDAFITMIQRLPPPTMQREIREQVRKTVAESGHVAEQFAWWSIGSECHLDFILSISGTESFHVTLSWRAGIVSCSTWTPENLKPGAPFRLSVEASDFNLALQSFTAALRSGLRLPTDTCSQACA